MEKPGSRVVFDQTSARRYPACSLARHHEDRLARAGILPDVAADRGYRTVTEKIVLARNHFAEQQRRVPGILIPVFPAVGTRNGAGFEFAQFRPDSPRPGRRGRLVKYETAAGGRNVVDCLPMTRPFLGDPSIVLIVTEGSIKSDAVTSAALREAAGQHPRVVCVSIPGVWSWRGRNGSGGLAVLPDWEAVAVNDRRVVLAFDSDAMTIAHVYKALVRLKRFLEGKGAVVEVAYLPGGADGGKQGADDYLAAGHSLGDLLGLATPEMLPPAAHSGNGGSAPREREVAADLAAIRREAAAVYEAADPFARIEQGIRAQGYGGDIGPAKLVHLGLTTRVLRMRPGAMPAHLLLHGQTSSGKNHALNVNLRLLPVAAYHKIDAGTPSVLIYDDADLRHRAVIFGEADSLPAGEDSPAASAVRNLLQDHHLHYKVTVRDPRSGGFTVREIDKPGPTILVTTATRRLGHQLESRLFVVDVPDDQDQLKQALDTQADVELDGVPEPDAAVIAYQSLLQAEAPWDVVVPFVKGISTALGRGPLAARVLRDFSKVIALVKTVAIIRHPRRRRDVRGRLVAEIADYRTVHELVGSAYATTTTGAGEGVRRVVAAVAVVRDAGKDAVSISDAAAQQGVHKSTASRHVRAAIDGGWLVNRDARPGRYDLDIGDPLPADGLPSPEEVEAAYCTVSAATMQPTERDEPKTGAAAGCPPGDGASNSRAADPSTGETRAPDGLQDRGCTVAGVTERNTRTYATAQESADTGDAPTDLGRIAKWGHDGRATWFRAMGESFGHPRLQFDGGRAVAAGREAWGRFACLASVTDMDLAIAAVEALDASMRSCPTCRSTVLWRSSTAPWACRRCAPPPTLSAVSGWFVRTKCVRWSVLPPRFSGALALARRVPVRA